MVLLLGAINAPPHNETNIDAQYNAASVSAPMSPDERIADYTLGLDILTLMLVVVAAFQIVLLLRSEDVAKTSAQAALKSANVAERSLVDVERPWLIVSDVHGVDFLEVGKAPNFPVRLSNSGRSVAIMRQLSGGGKSAQSVDLENLKMSSFELADLLGGAVPPGKMATGNIKIKEPMSQTTVTELQAGGAIFVLRFVLSYVGPTGGPYTTAVCVKWDSKSGQFVGYGGEKYNYIT